MAATITVDRIDVTKKGILELAHSQAMADAAAEWARTIARSVNGVADATNLRGKAPTLASPAGVGADVESVFGKVNTYDPGWHFLEYGTYNQSPTAPFRIGVQRTGVRYVDGGAGV